MAWMEKYINPTLERRKTMGRPRRLYIATNIKTGEKIIGDTLELYAALNINTKAIYQYSYNESLYKDTWKIEIYDDNPSQTIPRKYVEENLRNIKTCEDLEQLNREEAMRRKYKEWDEITAAFKSASEVAKTKEKERTLKKKSGFRTPYR